MNRLRFERSEFRSKLTTTVYGQSVEIRKRKVGRYSRYSYKIGMGSWGRFYTKEKLNKMLKPHGVKVE